jgi:hypothetical protein
MGGTIEVESAVGHGSKFTFSIKTEDDPARLALPASDAPSVTSPATLSDNERALRVLVVEDDETNLALVLLLLAKIGLRADSVGDGIACLNAMQSRHYDLVFMDLRMPELDGIETTRKLRCGAYRGNGQVAGFIPRTGNVGLSWDYKKFGISTNYNYTSLNIRSFDAANPSRNQYLAPRDMVNLNLRYQLPRNMTLTFGVANIFNEPQRYYRGIPDQLETFLVNGTTVTAGIEGRF